MRIRPAPTIAEAMARPHNAFSALRLLLALAVVVSHAFSVTTGIPADEPLMRATGFSLGEHAVNGFFAVSGFLVTMSLEQRGARGYVVARALRIAPGLLAATFVVTLLLGGALTRLPLQDYLGAAETWRFVRDTLWGFKSNASLPGLFEANPYRSPLGTVWTLKYETLCYLGLLLAGLAGLFRRRWLAPALAAALAIALVILDTRPVPLAKGAETALRLPLLFTAGAALYLWRGRIRLAAWPLLLLGLALAIQANPLYRPLLFLGESYAVIWLALAPSLARPAFDPPADLSYGVYLYGWPIQQALHALWPSMGPATLLAPSLLLALLAGALSWYAVEKPALRLKARQLGARAHGTIEPAGP